MAGVLVWKGIEVRNLGDFVNALDALDSRDEAREFMLAYTAVNEHARENVGYCSGYLDPEQSLRVREWCLAPHPIFGMSTPTPQEAFEAGRRLGAAMIAEREYQ